jgi:hypothetical protein
MKTGKLIMAHRYFSQHYDGLYVHFRRWPTVLSLEDEPNKHTALSDDALLGCVLYRLQQRTCLSLVFGVSRYYRLNVVRHDE